MNANYNLNYNLVNAIDYATDLAQKGAPELKAEKIGCVIAKKAIGGEKIIVYTSDGKIEAEETANVGDWVLTRANFDGTPVIDSFGHTNTWCIKPTAEKTADQMMAKKYDMANITPDGFVKPKGGVQTFIQVDMDICLMVPWGENGALIPQYVDKGGYINVTKANDIYGIGYEEFHSTYRVL